MHKIGEPWWIFWGVISRKFHFFHRFEPFLLSWGMAGEEKRIMGKREIWIEIPHPDLFPIFSGNWFPSFQFLPFICDRNSRSPEISDFCFSRESAKKLGASFNGLSTNGILWECRMGKSHAWNPVRVWIWLQTRSRECESRNSRNIFHLGLFHD